MNSGDGISVGIVVVSDDLACETKVAEVLRRCVYRFLRTQTVDEAIREIGENKERLNIVITNLHKLENGVASIEHINQSLKLNVLLIPGDERIEQKGEALGFSVYIVKGLDLNVLKNLLGLEAFVPNHQEKFKRAFVDPINAAAAAAAAAVIKNEASDAHAPHHKGKKPRVTWTDEMHHKFEDAIKTLGDDKAVPNEILMKLKGDFPGLTREKVASHLQKYRYSINAQKSSKSVVP